MKKLLLLSITLLALTVACGESEQDIKVAELEKKIVELESTVLGLDKIIGEIYFDKEEKDKQQTKLDRRITELEIEHICSDDDKMFLPYYSLAMRQYPGGAGGVMKRAICSFRDDYKVDKFIKNYEYAFIPEQYLNYLSVDSSSAKAKDILIELIEEDYKSIFVKK